MKTELLKELRRKFAEHYKVVTLKSDESKYAIIRNEPAIEQIPVNYVADSGELKTCVTDDLGELKLIVRMLAHQFMKREIKELRKKELNRKFIYPW